MPSLKSFRTRIRSVKSTQKITAAMKLVAGVKLRKSEEFALAARPYAVHIKEILSFIYSRARYLNDKPPLLIGREITNNILLIAFSSDRGLCGSFNSYIAREVSRLIKTHQQNGYKITVLCIGRKSGESLKKNFPEQVSEIIPGFFQETLENSNKLANKIINEFEVNKIDKAYLIYSKFKSAVTREIMIEPLIPVSETLTENTLEAIPEFEPTESEVLSYLLTRNISIQIYQAALESFASEQGARMMAMDNATRNAKDLVLKLTLKYNHTRQAQITKELSEVISGAEAL